MTLSSALHSLGDLHEILTAADFEVVVAFDPTGREVGAAGTVPPGFDAAAARRELEAAPPGGVSQGRWCLVQRLRAYGAELGVLLWVARRHTAPGLRAAATVGRLVERVGTLHYELDNLSGELADTYESFLLLCDVTQAASRVTRTGQLCRLLLEKLVSQVQCRRGAILLLEGGSADRGTLRVAAAVGEPGRWREGDRVPLEGLLHELVARGHAVLVDSVPAHEGSAADPLSSEAVESLLAAPMESADGLQGVLVLFDRRTGGVLGRFDSADRKLAEALASQGAAMIATMRVVEYSKEMEIGRRIQQSLLPAEIPRGPGFQAAGTCVMARGVGGDFYDVAVSEAGEVKAVIADVSGHDLGSALLMASARTQFHSELRGQRAPDGIMRHMNQVLHRDLNRAGLFLTYFVLSLDTTTGCLRYAAGGHNPAILVRADGSCSFLESTGLPAGVTLQVAGRAATLWMQPGEQVLVYTDGFPEALNPGGEMFGEERLAALVSRHRDDPPGEILSRLHEEVRRFSGSDVFQDDGTAILIRWTALPGQGAAPSLPMDTREGVS